MNWINQYFKKLSILTAIGSLALTTLAGCTTETASNPTKQPSSAKTDQENQNTPVGDESQLIDQVATDNLPIERANFDDLKTINSSPKVVGHYAAYDALAAWDQLKQNQQLIINQLNLPHEITQKYQITIIEDQQTIADQQSGTIKHLVVKFTQSHEYQTVRFDLTGFKINQELQKLVNHKSEFLTKKELSANIKHLFPSLVAQMLLFNEDPNQFPPVRNIKDGHHYLGYDTFLNKNSDFFGDTAPTFGPGFKSSFFEINQKYQTQYKYKIVGVKFDDLKGTLSLNVRITNTDENRSSEPEAEYAFDFNGLRKIDVNNINSNVLSFSILQSKVKEALKDDLIKKDLPNLETKGQLSNSALNKLKSLIYKEIYIVIHDNNNVYHLGISDLKLSDLGGLNQNFGVYPFYTRYVTKDIYQDFQIALINQDNNKQIQVSFKIKLPILVVENFGTLADFNYAANSSNLTYSITQTVAYNQITN